MYTSAKRVLSTILLNSDTEEILDDYITDYVKRRPMIINRIVKDMKLWVISASDVEHADSYVIGIYQSKEKAINALLDIIEEYCEENIELLNDVVVDMMMNVTGLVSDDWDAAWEEFKQLFIETEPEDITLGLTIYTINSSKVY